MARSDGMRFLDGLLITTVLVAFTWFIQGTTPSIPVVAAIVIAAAFLAIWVPHRRGAAAIAQVPSIVLFAGTILGFVAGGQALRLASGVSTGGFVLAVVGIACLTIAVATVRMIGWRSQHADRNEAARA